MPADFVEELKRYGLGVDQVLHPTVETLKELIKGYDALVVRSATKVTADVIERADKLKVIGRAGAGLDNIDVEAAVRKGIKIVNVPEAVANAVAELTIGMIISLLRSIPQAVESLKSGRWEKSKLIGRELSGMRVGVVGLGTIGTLVAQKLTVLGAHVIAYRRNREALLREAARMGIEPADGLEDLLSRCELVTLHLPYTSDTHLLINERMLRLMRKGSYLVNTSRAWIVDGKALLHAIEDGTLDGAAVDVHYNEPPKEEWEWQLIKHPKVIATPHIGAQTKEAGFRISRTLASKLVEALMGQRARMGS